ncbi:MAG: PKD domain-containing protein [Chloroflexi bacterium]|nr:PKD domain-containing protein [Chloroflexota bacterium]
MLLRAVLPVLVIGSLVIAGAVSKPSTAAAPEVQVVLEMAGILRIGAGNSGDVKIVARNVAAPDGLAAYDLRIFFDHQNLVINSVSGGPAPFSDLPTSNIGSGPGLSNSTGVLKLNSYHSSRPAPHGNVHLATINVSALTGGIHLMLTEVVILADYKGNGVAASGILKGVPAFDPPAADFSAGQVSGKVPLAVNFMDLSTGPPASWAWDLNGDSIFDSNTKNPAYVYSSPGNYTVSLAVQNPQGASTKTVAGYVRAYDNPEAWFSANKIRGRAPLTVDFTDESKGNIASWEWDLNGDGSADSSSQNPSYRYNRAGKYTVTLKASNPAGADTRTRTNLIQVDKLRVKKQFKVERDEDGVIVLPIDITDITDPGTGAKIKPNKGITSFRGEVTAPGGVSILAGRKGGNNFNDPTISSTPGKAVVEGSSRVPAKHEAATRLAKLVPRLTGNKDAFMEIVLSLQSITEGDDDTEMEEEEPSSLSFRRGAARGRNNSDITDSLFVAQYLAGLREDSEINLLNAASISHDGGSGDRITIVDSLAMAQYLAGLRDDSFVLRP